MATRKICSAITLSRELEDLHRAQASAAEEYDKNMRKQRLETEKRITELVVKISAQDKLNLENEGAKSRLLERKKDAQILMTMVKRQVELQEAQETKQIELIKKQKEEREQFEVLLQEQCLKLQAEESCDFGTERLELEKEAVQKIANLEEKLKDLEEDLEFQHDLVHTLTMSQRQLTDDVQATMSLVIRSNFFKESGTFNIRVKMLGELNIKGWYEACGHKFTCEERFSEWVTKIDEKLRTPAFIPPLKSVPDGNNGKMKFAIDEDDKWLTELRNKFGPIVANGVGTAALEIETWNSSGRYAVPVPWDNKKNKRATMSSIFEYLDMWLKCEQELHRTVSEKMGMEHVQLTRALQEKTKEVEEKDKQIKALSGAVSALTCIREGTLYSISHRCELQSAAEVSPEEKANNQGVTLSTGVSDLRDYGRHHCEGNSLVSSSEGQSE